MDSWKAAYMSHLIEKGYRSEHLSLEEIEKEINFETSEAGIFHAGWDYALAHIQATISQS